MDIRNVAKANDLKLRYDKNALEVRDAEEMLHRVMGEKNRIENELRNIGVDIPRKAEK